MQNIIDVTYPMPQLPRAYMKLPNGTQVNVFEVTEVRASEAGEICWPRGDGKSPPLLLVSYRNTYGSGGTIYIGVPDYNQALLMQADVVAKIEQIRNKTQPDNPADTGYDPRLHALALHLDEHPANIRKVEEHLYRATLEPDEQGGAPQQVDYFVMTLEEAQTEWESDGDHKRIRPGVDLTPTGSYYIFEA